MRRLVVLLTAALAMLGCYGQHAGGDISLLTRYEQNGAIYLDPQGERIGDMLSYLKTAGWTMMRVRLFVDPSEASATDKGQGVCQDLDYVKALGARIKAAGFKLMLDFHYSDSWADPAKQYTPAAWVGLNDEELNSTIYNYTRNCLLAMAEAGAVPDYIQTGNEISYGMLWGKQGSSSLKKCFTSSNAHWDRFASLLKNAGRACREICPQARIVIHTERVAQIDVLEGIYTRLDERGVDYDVMGLSYYPYYHGTLTQLDNALTRIDSRFPGKEVMIVEAGYYHAWQPSGVDYDLSSTFAISDDGQQAFTQALIATLNKHKQVNGLLWWWPEACEYGLDWNTRRVTDQWYNAGLWDNSTGRALKTVATLGAYAGSKAELGDVNGDGTVDISDVNMVINAVLRGDYSERRTDVNNDGTVDISDVNAVINCILHA